MSTVSTTGGRHGRHPETFRDDVRAGAPTYQSPTGGGAGPARSTAARAAESGAPADPSQVSAESRELVARARR